jgi:DNA-binding transcriptional MerR regulator
MALRGLPNNQMVKADQSMSNCTQNTTREAVDDSYGESVGEPDSMKKHALTIGVVAQMFKVSKFALRLYELRGLIERERYGQERVYSWFECERIALLVKARNVGLATGDVSRVIEAMDERASTTATDAGRQQCLTLIRSLEDQRRAIGDVLGEFYRIDWELSERHRGKDTKSSGALTEKH